MTNRITKSCPGGVYEPGQLTKHYIEQAVEVRGLTNIAEHLKEVLEITINGLRKNSHFTSYRKKHIKSLVARLGKYTKDLELATLEIFRASNYADVEDIDEETSLELEILTEMALDARSNLTMLHVLTRQQLPPYLKTTTHNELEDVMLARHQKSIKDISNDFITNHRTLIRYLDNSEYN